MTHLFVEAYALGVCVVAILGLIMFLATFNGPHDAVPHRWAARAVLLSPLWPVSAVVGLVVALRVLVRDAELRKW